MSGDDDDNDNHLEIAADDGDKKEGPPPRTTTIPLDGSVVRSLAVLGLVGLIDAVSYMAVAPSLIFYVKELGGTKEQYGAILSAFSFASFCFKPVYGRWVDSSGNRYRVPYVVSFSAAMAGNLLYFAAVLLPGSRNAGVYGLLAGRFMAGMGAANNTLGYSYVATVVPHDRQTSVNVLLSMTRILGMTMGPLVNLLLGEIDTEVRLFNGVTIPVNPYNSVGLFVAAGQLSVLTVALLFFREPEGGGGPSSDGSIAAAATARTAAEAGGGVSDLWEAVLRRDRGAALHHTGRQLQLSTVRTTCWCRSESSSFRL